MARASFIQQSTARTKTSTSYCADLKLIVGFQAHRSYYNLAAKGV